MRSGLGNDTGRAAQCAAARGANNLNILFWIETLEQPIGAFCILKRH